jgi:hypothetical protein
LIVTIVLTLIAVGIVLRDVLRRKVVHSAAN